MAKLVEVQRCDEYGHADGPHMHVEFDSYCPHGKPLRYECFTCTFGYGIQA